MTCAQNRPGHRGFVPRPLVERFWSRVEKRGPDDCWLWTGAKNNQGYGTIGLGGRAGGYTSTHRTSWALANGPIPPKMHICHSCDNPGCVNPNHLWLGTARDNVLDMLAKGRGREQRKTHCPQGHEYNEANTYRWGGGRHCRACERDRRMARRA